MAKNPPRANSAAKILVLSLPTSLHRRFLKEARAYDGNGGSDKEKFLFLLMNKYLNMSKKRSLGNCFIS